MTNVFWLTLYVALVAAVGAAAYFIGEDRGEEQGRQDAMPTSEEVRYFDASIATLARLGYTWDGSNWVEPSGVSSLPAAPTPIPDRTSCAEIEGTPYRSPNERVFYLGTCLGQPVTPEPLCGEPPNPWCYDLFPGTLISSPPGEFCGYFECAENFWAGTGHVIRCRDGVFNKTGGLANPCASNGGVAQPLYAH